MAQIPANPRELRHAHHLHKQDINDQSSASNRLLMFYSIECGLKCIYLNRIGLRTTDQIRQASAEFGHDLRSLIIELRLPATVTQQNTTFHLKKDHTGWSIADIHQAWRYGVEVDPQDEQRLTRWFVDLNSWIDKNI